jgi:hypothetical protein
MVRGCKPVLLATSSAVYRGTTLQQHLHKKHSTAHIASEPLYFGKMLFAAASAFK